MRKYIIADIALIASIIFAVVVLAEPQPEIMCEVTQPVVRQYTEAKMTIPQSLIDMPKPDPKPIYTRIDENELEMLAILIYQEAGGDTCCDKCRYRVADVALNRVNDPRFPDTLEEVLLQQGQYGMLHWTGIKWASRAKNDCEKHAVERAYAVAEDVLKGNHSELYGNGYIWQAGFHQGYDEVHCCGHYFGK